MASNASDAAGGCSPPVPGRRPLIGLTTYLEASRHGVWNVVSALLPAAYVDGVRAAGGRPVLLPPCGPGAPAWSPEELADLDALVLTGGADVAPACYGQQPAPSTGSPSPERDHSEIALLRGALALGLPVLGICRGAQVLNVALGGTLHQHLPDVLGSPRHQVSPAVFASTTVRTEPGSRVHGLLGEEVEVRCYHHQAVDRLAEGLRVAARAPDGTVEAVEAADPGAGFCVGVQWHPEQDERDVRLFAAVVDAARRRGTTGADGRGQRVEEGVR
ncbi:putative glutamine amidotransferase [Kineococcus xinjiangensis]|uniref:Putative glutamine amidotransferase n=1 Tax=Kineococcus xinjiangensis TaxID=512762 RepID=A0A2S6IW28_9ACTN|nr:gamma-glutamyl-gamma-aminobutyrate hydrolase family protein [Kineococcus xinjiangensis]PPK98361.1 putative glutamine amidotransferase [Kineococcus xinjiangensis]